MEFKVFRSIHKIEREWRSLVDSPTANVYRTYEYFELLYKLRRLDPDSYRRGNWRCRFVVGYEDGTVAAIAPLVLDCHPRKVFGMLGNGTSIGNTDFIYREEKYGRELFAYIKGNILKGCPMELWRVDEASFLVKEMNLNYIRSAMKVEMKDFETYRSSLSRNMITNIQNAYNRLSSDAIDWKIETYCGGDPEIRRVVHKVASTYYFRMDKKNGQDRSSSSLRRFYMASRDITFASLFKTPSVRMHVMYVCGEIAYFIIGYECGNAIYIPHCAMNEKYARYSPGILTIIDWIKERSAYGPVTMDLGAGDEPYKKSLGCEGYSLYMLTTE